ncbi:MAG: hypothetical protein Kow00106_24040 [Anaerolineae bacterium]
MASRNAEYTIKQRLRIRQRQLTFDRIPGLLVWLALALTIVGAVRNPHLILTIAAALGLYFAARSVLAGVANVMAVRQTARWEQINWRDEYARRRTPDSLAWETVHHVAIIPNYRESAAKMHATLERLADFPDAPTMLTVVLAMEADEAGAHQRFEQLHAAFADRFCRLIYTAHPPSLPGEMPGKAANEAWAAREVHRLLVKELGYPLDNLVVTVMDADSMLHPRYLEALTCCFATDPNRWRAFWQPPVRYHNNVWELSALISMVHLYSAAWETAYLTAPWWFALPYSTYSTSLCLLHEVGYWEYEPEDHRIYAQSFFHYRGDAHTRPIFLPASVDATTGPTLRAAFRARYQQTARHAMFGVWQISHTLDQALHYWDKLPPRSTLGLLVQVTHDQFMAGAGWMVLVLGPQLSILLHPSLLSGALPQIAVLSIAMAVVALAGAALWFLDWAQRPARYKPWTWRERLLALAWSLAV